MNKEYIEIPVNQLQNVIQINENAKNNILYWAYTDMLLNLLIPIDYVYFGIIFSLLGINSIRYDHAWGYTFYMKYIMIMYSLKIILEMFLIQNINQNKQQFIIYISLNGLVLLFNTYSLRKFSNYYRVIKDNN